MAAVVGVAIWYFMLPTPAAAMTKADDLNMKGKFAEAQAVLKQARWRAYSRTDKQLLQVGLANSNYDAGNLAVALGDYQQAEKLGTVDYGTALAAGDAAERLGNKAEAVRQYQLAMDGLKNLPKSEVQQENPDALQAKITELQQ